jgi:hypothetical protein
MTTQAIPTEHVPDGVFPSAAFCVFCNHFMALIAAAIAVKIKHGAVFANKQHSTTSCHFAVHALK